MENIEKEIKYKLSQEDFYKFKKFLDYNKFSKVDSFIQVNYYIDTKEMELEERDITARIRMIFGDIKKYEFTIKIPVLENNLSNIKIKKEFTIGLDSVVAEKIINNINNIINYRSLLNDISKEVDKYVELSELRILGTLETKREYYVLNKDYDPINIDVNSYLNRKDYEIEWETDNVFDAKPILDKILSDLGIVSNNNCLSKNCRFFNRYLKIKH